MKSSNEYHKVMSELEKIATKQYREHKREFDRNYKIIQLRNIPFPPKGSGEDSIELWTKNNKKD